MTNPDRTQPPSTDRMLEELLQRAPPRSAPSEDAAAAARQALMAEWRQQTKQRKGRRRLVMLATAASVALAAVLSMNTWLAPVPAPIQVAEVGRASGTIFVLGEKAEMLEAPGLTSVVTGQSVRTDRGAVIGFDWLQGGSLRLDQNTEVAFLAKDRIELVSGRVYFDSEEHPDSLIITTKYGDVSHLGTAYMASVDSDDLTISVRDGKVVVATRFGDEIAARGQQLRIEKNRRVSERLHINTYGADWEWLEIAAAAPVLHGKTIYDLLLWVSRETGLRFDFDDSATEFLVRHESVEGDISDSPRVALRQSLLTANLKSNLDDVSVTKSGVVLIRQ